MHWDYQRQKPKNLDDSRKKKQTVGTKKKKRGTFSFIFSCLSKSSRNASHNGFNKDLDHDSDDEIKELCKNKSLLLVLLWKKGVPSWVRKTLWPIAIGNRLEVIMQIILLN